MEQVGAIPRAGQFARFYAPLAGTSLLLTVTNPILAGALARGWDPTSTLSGFGVAFALIGVLYAPLLVAQPVTAARIIHGVDPTRVWQLSVVLGGTFSAVAALVAFTPFGRTSCEA